MAEIWEQNEEKGPEDELVVTAQRDSGRPAVEPEDQQAVETTEPDPRDALEELGEDVSSSPARRGHEDPEEAAMHESEG
ncbi:hypothetical protein AB3K78_04860 [Leucobacter sp. HNU]|uniref:hypothetical protein n=1 Tax=Leucobacter sp. HNU TaxID=3236805 RepID=UPI003A806916